MNRVTKDLVLAASILIVGAAFVGAQPAWEPLAATAAPTNAVGPRMQFATPVYDFGRARAGEPIKYSYTFTNTGDSVLILNSVQPGCHCTTAGEWTKQVEPGKTGVIPIQFDTTGTSGMIVRQITVSCNITNQPLTFLQIKGTVYKPIDINPPWAVLNLPADVETGSMLVSITNNTEEPLFFTAAQSNNRMFSAELVTNTPGRGYQLKVSTVPPLGPGSVQGQIVLKTSWTNPAVIPVTVVANIQQALMVIPSFMTLGPGPLPNPITNSVTIQNNSTNRLTLSDPEVNMPGVAAAIRELQPGKTFSAMLSFPQGFQIPPGQRVELSLKSSNPRVPVVKVPVMQLARPVSPILPSPAAPAAVRTPTLVPPPPAGVAPATPTRATPTVTPVRRVSPVAVRAPSPPPPLPPTRQ